MKIVAIDTEYDYMTPFLATSTDEQLRTTVYRLSEPTERQMLKRLCERKDVLKVFHNVNADRTRLKNVGISVVRPYGCTMVASSLVDENYAPRALKKLARGHLNEDTHEANRLKSVIKTYKKRAAEEQRVFRWSDIPDKEIIPYAKRDPEYTIKLWYYFQKPLSRVLDLYNFELSLVPILNRMYHIGLRVDREFCAQKQRAYEQEMARIAKAANAFVAEQCKLKAVDLDKTRQIADVIQRLHLPITKRTATGLPKTDKDTLMEYKSPFVDLLNEWRFYTKHYRTYYKPLHDYYTSVESDIGHFDLYQTGAKTGRFSAELIQTFPRPDEDKSRGKRHEVRRAIRPREGKWFVCIDYKQIEMWLFVHYANCTRVIERAGRENDVYLETADILFGELMSRPELKKPLRKVAKTMALGMIYGIGVKKLVKSIVHEMSESVGQKVIDELGISVVWAYRVLDRFYRLYPVRQLMHAKTSEIYRQGYFELRFDSSLMKFHRYYHVPKELAYKGVNAMIQGTAAYIIKCAMLRYWKEWGSQPAWQGGGVELLMQVHDELIFEIDKRLPLKSTVRKLVRLMEDHVTFRVPIFAEPKVSDVSWADVQTLEVFHVRNYAG